MASDGTIKISTKLDNKETEKALSKFSSFARTGLKGVATAVTAVSTGLAGVSGYAVKVGVDFEAQMSRVKAISGATGEEFEQLRQEAIKLGSDTAFSASEAAQGMENLAAAGFTTNEIMSAMPGMLDLAAASGEDLANSADIAASTLRGFGLEASEAGHVADVLAENANRTNSSVAETGEAMKYIAPLARAAGISMEETAAAIGIMANAGVQGSQAGTTLRGALSRLSKPTDVMQQAMDELGVSFYDSEGKMLSLTDQVGVLQSAMEGMTDEQKNNYLVTLYGQEALSGMLVLINEGPESLSSLASAYESCDGAAQAAAATMQDNLKGAIEGLAGSAETLAILFYDKVSGGMKDAVQVVDESVDNITKALNNGGIDAAVKAAGSEFANLATEVAGHAPAMIGSAVKFIQSFASGIYSNRRKILSAAGNVATAFGEGLADLLPSSISGPVKTVVREIGKSFKSGGIRSAISTVSTAFKNFSNVVGKVAKVTLPPLTKALDFVSGNLDKVVPLVAAGTAAFKTYGAVTKTVTAASKAYTTASKALNAMEKANALQLVATNGGLTIQQTLIALRNGQISVTTALTGLWAKAQNALNVALSSNPIGLAVTVIAALAATIGTAVLMTDKASASTGKLTEKQKESIDASKEAIKNIKEEAEARQKNINASTAEIDNAEALWRELQKCVDANGKVKSGYEARAKYIAGELSDALGTEISLTDGIITNYQELEGSIKDVMAAKKAEAIMNAMQEEYTTAMQEQAEKAEELAATYEELNRLKERQAELEAEAAELASSTNYADATRYAEIKEELAGINSEMEVQKAKFDEANTAMQDNQKVISDYNLIAEAAMSGSTERINAALAQIQSGIDTTLTVGSEAAIEQANTTANTLTNILQGEADGLYSLQNATKESLAESMGMALNQVGSGAGKMKRILTNAGEEGSAQIVAAMAKAKISGTLSEEAQAGMESFISGFAELDSETQEIWSQAWYGALAGLEGFEKLADPAEEGADAFLESLRLALDVNSPSRAVSDIFSQVWPGAVEGLNRGRDGLNKAGSSVVNEFLSSLTSSGVISGAKKIGANIMTFFGKGIGSQKKNSEKQGKVDADAAKKGVGSADPSKEGKVFGSRYAGGISGTKSAAVSTATAVSNAANRALGFADTNTTGRNAGRKYSSGINGQKGTAASAASSVSNAANKALGAVNTAATGQNSGSKYASGIRSKANTAYAGGKKLASSADSGARSKTGYDAGSGFGAGFASGIQAWVGSAVASAANLAASALASAKRTINSNSPAKETIKLGKYFGQGFELGIDGEVKAVAKSSENLAKAALQSLDVFSVEDQIKALDVASVVDQIHEAMSDVNFKISDRVTTKMEIADRASAMKEQEKRGNLVKLSDDDIRKLAREFGIVAGSAVSDKMDGMKIRAYDRDFARVVKEAQRS